MSTVRLNPKAHREYWPPVVKSSAVVKDGKIIEYHVNVKLAFIIEGSEIEKP